MESTPRGPAWDEEWREAVGSPTFGYRICPAHRTVIAYSICVFYDSEKYRQRGTELLPGMGAMRVVDG